MKNNIRYAYMRLTFLGLLALASWSALIPAFQESLLLFSAWQNQQYTLTQSANFPKTARVLEIKQRQMKAWLNTRNTSIPIATDWSLVLEQLQNEVEHYNLKSESLIVSPRMTPKNNIIEITQTIIGHYTNTGRYVQSLEQQYQSVQIRSLLLQALQFPKSAIIHTDIVIQIQTRGS